MRILALGNKRNTYFLLPTQGLNLPKKPQRGFTLMELMVVVAIIAIASAGVVFAIPDSSATALERDAQRLSALLDSARAQSRASGLFVTWHATDNGFKFEGLPKAKNKRTGELEDLSAMPSTWLDANTHADTAARLILGPEPIIQAQSVVLTHANRSVTVATDGLRPFAMDLKADATPVKTGTP